MAYRSLPAILVLVASTLAAASSAAGAADGGHVLGYTKAQSTSTCIGDPKTPLCAIETFAACQVWSRQDYCDLVGHWRTDGRVADNYTRLKRYPFEVSRPLALTTADIPAWARAQGRHAWKPGDLMIQLWWSGCSPDSACVMATINDPKRPYGESCPATNCGRDPHPDTYVTRMVGERWQVVDWKFDPLPDVQNLFESRK